MCIEITLYLFKMMYYNSIKKLEYITFHYCIITVICDICLYCRKEDFLWEHSNIVTFDNDYNESYLEWW